MRAGLYRGVWCAIWSENGRTRRRSLRIGGNPEDRGLAEQIIRDSRREPVGHTVAALMEAYLADREQTVSAPERLRDAWKALRPMFGSLTPDRIDRDLCRRYIAHRRRQGRGDGTIRKELSTLRTALRWNGVAAASFDIPGAPPPRERYLTRDEYRRLLEGASDPHIELFIVLAVATAGRATAILELTWDRVDFNRGRIRLGEGERRRKGRATVPMTNAARAALEEARPFALTDHVIEYAGRPVKSVKKGIASAARRAGLENVTPHVLRHTSAVWMAEDGVPMTQIAQHLGHSDSRTTERVYARYSPDYLRAAASALEV